MRPNREQEDIDWETRDIAGFDMDLSGIQEVDGFDIVDRAVEDEDAFLEALLAEGDSMMNRLESEALSAQHTVERAGILAEEGVLSAEDASYVVEHAQIWDLTMTSNQRELKTKMGKLNDDIHDFFSKASKNMENIAKEGIDQGIKDAKSALRRADTWMKKVDGLIGKNKKEIGKLEKALGLATLEEEKKLIRAEIKKAEAEGAELAKRAAEAKKLADESKTAQEIAQRAYDGSTFKRSTNAFDWLLKKTFIDISKTFDGLKQYSNDFHKAGEIMTTAHKAYYKKFASGSEDASNYWQEANDVSDREAKKESSAYSKNLRQILSAAETNDEEALLEAIAKFATPSSRMLIKMDARYTELIEKDLRRLTPAPLFRAEWVGYYGKRLQKEAQAAALRVSERVLGPEVVNGMIRGMGLVAELAGDLVEFYLGPELMVIELFGKTIKDLWTDGFTLAFLDDFLQNFFLSLDDFSKGIKILEYPKYPTLADDKGKKHPSLRMMEFDSIELQFVINFWGKQYHKFQKRHGHKYPAYKEMVKFDSISRIPGRYIKLDDHPLTPVNEIKANETLESLAGLNESGYTDKSLCHSWFPKIPGTVRNLREFPVYDQTYQWPDRKKGVPIQLTGYFIERDMDPVIVEAFKLWATNGTYGSVYNSSKSKRVRAAAVQANRADLQQWLDPQSNWPLAWNEVHVWLQGLHGKKGVMLNDMIELAPKEWLKEWDVDLPREEFSLYGFNGNRFGFFMNDLGYEDIKAQTGRYTYRPLDLTFLRNVRDKGIMVSLVTEQKYRNLPYNKNNHFVEEYNVKGDYLHPAQKWVAYSHPASQAQRKKYTDILEKGLAWKARIESDSKDVIAKWKLEALKIIWKDYVRVEKPQRSVWSYIARYKSNFIEELMFVVNSLAGDQRTKTWQNYLKKMAGLHIPLQMNSLHRVTFMGMFASLAYPSEAHKDDKFIATIKKKFGGILHNDLVTTSQSWKKWIWTHGLDIVKVVKNHGVFDFPIMFGELNARIFVLNKPRVIVIAVKGTKSMTDWLIDADFSTGHYVTMKHDKEKNMLNLDSIENGTKRSPEDLNGSQEIITVHRGFLRAATALKGEINKLLLQYMKKYDDIQDIFITGHSLGAAVTQILAMMVPRLHVKSKKKGKSGFKNPNCYMFSSPAVGDERFAKQFGIWSGESAQVWIDGDAIVSIPPFLLPDEHQSARSYQLAKDSMRILSGKRSAFNGALFAISMMFKNTQLPSQLDFPELWKDFNTFDKKRFGALIGEIAKAANENRALRGGEVFMRLDGLNGLGFVESAYDSGNSESIYYKLFNTPHLADHLLSLHKIENSVGLLTLIAAEHPDLFDLDSENIPSWDDGGTIDPSDDPSDKKVDEELAKMLEDGTAHIIGYGKSKHWHKPWSMVAREDVVMGAGVFFSSSEKEIMSGLKHNGSRKRRKIDKADHTYRGHDYI